MNSFKVQMSSYVKSAEDALNKYLPMQDTKYNIVTEAMRYSLIGGGKRIRACLLLANYNEFEKDISHALPFSSAIEMVHAYSLIHDDLPCMDDDNLRRGKASCHIKYGEANALLAGDGLLTNAFSVIFNNVDTEKISPNLIIKASAVLANSCGYNGMIGGQVLDLQNENKTLDINDIEYINNLKTGKLIEAACVMGAIIGGANDIYISEISQYANKIGIAFQIADDILDSIGDEKKLGKPIGSDKVQGKTTYVTIYGVDKSKEIALSLIKDAKSHLDNAKVKSTFLYDLADIIVNREN